VLGPLTYLDVGLVLLCAVSGLLATARGFSREFLSIMSWVLACAAGVWVISTQPQWIDQLSEQVFKSKPVAMIALGAVVFLIVLLVVHFITMRISNWILESGVGLVDRILGFIFGLARGYLIVVLALLLGSFLLPDDPEQHPTWIRDAQSIGALRSTGKSVISIFKGVLPEELSVSGLLDGGS